MKKLMMVLFAIALWVVAAVPSFAADRSAQIAHERNMEVSALADAIEACGDNSCRPRGLNTDAEGFLHAVQQHASGSYKELTLDELPDFLRSLEKRALPPNEDLCLAGMRGEQVITTCKERRKPHPGEWGWYDGETLVLAGDCLNAVVHFSLASTEVKATPYQVTTRERTDPFASRRQTVAGCDMEGERWFGVIVFEPKAAEHECAVRTMLPYGGLMGAREGGGNSGTYHDANRFSRTCGTALRTEWRAGKLALSSTPHDFEVFVERPGGKEDLLFVGTVTGNVITAPKEHRGLIHESGNLLFLPDEYQDGTLVVRYLNPDELRTPTASGTGERVENIKTGCSVGAFHAITAGSERIARRGE
jgi:hypothetical protein